MASQITESQAYNLKDEVALQLKNLLMVPTVFRLRSNKTTARRNSNIGLFSIHSIHKQVLPHVITLTWGIERRNKYTLQSHREKCDDRSMPTQPTWVIHLVPERPSWISSGWRQTSYETHGAPPPPDRPEVTWQTLQTLDYKREI